LRIPRTRPWYPLLSILPHYAPTPSKSDRLLETVFGEAEAQDSEYLDALREIISEAESKEWTAGAAFPERPLLCRTRLKSPSLPTTAPNASISAVST
jgi:hypothetical protein